METMAFTLPKDCTIVDTGDWHLGALNCYTKGVEKLIARVEKDPACFAILKGDMMEAILPHDKRFAFSSQDVSLRTPAEQARAVNNLLAPIAHKVIAYLIGNHEWKVINTINFAAEVAERLNIPFGGYSCCVQFQDEAGVARWRGFFTHGNGSLRSNAKDPIQRAANRSAGLKQKFVNLGIADCVYMSMGHIHQAMIVPPTIGNEVILTTRAGHLAQQYRTHTDQGAEYIPVEARWYAASPSMLKTFADPGSISYSEIAMYAPAELGWLEIDIRNHEVTDVRKVVV